MPGEGGESSAEASGEGETLADGEGDDGDDAGSAASVSTSTSTTSETGVMDGEGDAGTTEGDAETGVMETGEDDGGQEPLSRCFEACGQRAEIGDSMGFCAFDWMHDWSCETWCEWGLGSLDEVEYIEGIECIGTEPLCFENMEDCICRHTQTDCLPP